MQIFWFLLSTSDEAPNTSETELTDKYRSSKNFCVMSGDAARPSKALCLERVVAKGWIKWRSLPDTDWGRRAERTGRKTTHHELFQGKFKTIKLYLDDTGASAAKLAEGIPGCVNTLDLHCSFIYLF